MIVTVNTKFNVWATAKMCLMQAAMNNKSSSTITKRAQNIAHKTGVIS